MDIEKLIDAGYGERVAPAIWRAGMLMGIIKEPIVMIQAHPTPTGCTFFKDGLCELHNLGLKPTEGRLSHHILMDDNYNAQKHISWLVAKEWLLEENAEIIDRIIEKIRPILEKRNGERKSE